MEATSAFEAMEKMVQEKKLSKKINYDVLKDLNPSAFRSDAAAVEFTRVSAPSFLCLAGFPILSLKYQVDGVAQWLGHRSLAGRLSRTCARYMVDR